jgi:hypothetical protein
LQKVAGEVIQDDGGLEVGGEGIQGFQEAGHGVGLLGQGKGGLLPEEG